MEQPTATEAPPPRTATLEEQKEYLQNHQEKTMGTIKKLFDVARINNPTTEQLPPLTEIGKQVMQQENPTGDEAIYHNANIEMWPGMQRQQIANELFDSRVTPEDMTDTLKLFSKEDSKAIRKLFVDRIQAQVQSKKPIWADINGEKVQFTGDQEWLNTWNPQNPSFLRRGLNVIKHQAGKIPGVQRHGAESVKSGAEALIDRMGQALENTKVFGRSVADFALRKGATGVLRYGARELAKGIWSMSGAAGAIGGTAFGTPLAGAFAGAIGGTLVEYVRQVNKNLDQRRAGIDEADPALVGRRREFLWKIKEARHHREVLKPNDYRKLGKAALFGAIAGAGAGALSEHAPQLIGLIKEHMGGLESVASKAQDIAGHTAGKVTGAVGRTAGDIFGKAAHLPGVESAKEMAGEAWKTTTHTASNLEHRVGLGGTHEAGTGAVQIQELSVPQTDYDALQQQLNNAHQTIQDLHQQLADLGHTPEIPGVTPPADVVAGAAEQAVTHAQSALDNFGGSIPLEAGSNPWEVSTDILKQMGINNPTPAQVMELTKTLVQENHISVPEWGITGITDAHSLPIGFPLDLTDTVKKAALEIASKK